MQKKAIEKYLRVYSEVLSREVVSQLPRRQWSFSLNIPLRDEDDDFWESFHHLESILPKRSLLILVLNGSPTSKNQQLAMDLQNQGQLIQASSCFELRQIGHFDVLWINAFEGRFQFQNKEGVGKARRVGSDIALQLWYQQNLHSPWIACTDADAFLPSDYFKVLPDDQDDGSIAALHFPFFHDASRLKSLHQQALVLYEDALRYYVEGLEKAGSPYAFHSIGSCLAIHAPAYAIVRGFPNREAGEDFYMLNKLAKHGKIEQPQSSPIKLLGRLSTRVAFGTGPGTLKYYNLLKEHQEPAFYHPQVFVDLRTWLEFLRKVTPATNFPSHWKTLPQALQTSLAASCDLAFVEKAASRTQCQNRLQQNLMHWFDGWKTLKWIHELTRHQYPKIQASQARLSQIPSIKP